MSTTHAPTSPVKPARRSIAPWVFIIFWFLILALVAVLVLSLANIYQGDVILSGVTALGQDLGGRTRSEASQIINSEWQNRKVILDAGEQSWTLSPEQLGVILDAGAMAEEAYQQGRGQPGVDSLLPTARRILASSGLIPLAADAAAVTPVWSFDRTIATETIRTLAGQIDIPVQNAGVTVVDGKVQTTAGQGGRALDVGAMLATLESHPWDVALSRAQNLSLRFTMPVIQQAPPISDVSAIVNELTPLLASPITVELYDPIRDEHGAWTVQPADMGRWIGVGEALDESNGQKKLTWSVDEGKVRDYIASQEASFGDERHVDADVAAPAFADAFRKQQGQIMLTVKHSERQHVVKPGETLSSIAYDYGFPYPYLMLTNPGKDNLLAGDTITIPSVDVLTPLPAVENKRIVVNIPKQTVKVYENGNLKWDWTGSTGIDSSPTSPGIYQIQTHEEMAYAANWDLYMPWFMGIYRPVPGQEFMNGFHGFPSRDRKQLLWTKNLGHRVTYGCILVSTENAKLLYDWAEPGVIVEIQK
jgi:lipoprotein-anchoring transpeptidase ErfK/SrfK